MSLMQKESIVLIISVLILTVVAAIPRFYKLDSLGFYLDEKTTAPPSRSFAEGNGPKFPTGMTYNRAILQTWANALSANFFGLDKEVSYRIPSAVLGTLTVPLIFLLARPLFGYSVAILAAALISLSEWHILVSREARMYAPFLFFYFASGMSIWKWTVSAKLKYLVSGVVFFFLSLSFHYLSIILALIFVIPIAYPKWSRVPPWQPLVLSIFVVLVSEYYGDYIVSAAYDDWVSAHGVRVIDLDANSDVTERNWLPLYLSGGTPLGFIWEFLLGLIFGIWITWLNRPGDKLPGYRLRLFALCILGIITGYFLVIGQIYGAGLTAILFFLIHPDTFLTIAQRTKIPIIIAAAVSGAWIYTAITNLDVYEGLKSLATFPFPYFAFFAKMIPGTLALFVFTIIYLLITSEKPNKYALYASAFAATATIFGIGAIKAWGGMRYLIEAYPFLIFVSSAGLLHLSRIIAEQFMKSRSAPGLGLAILVVASGVLGGHGVPQALGVVNLHYGESVPSFPFSHYPDHKAAGEFVKNHLGSDDIVLAEDPLVQNWYVGRVDYALRDPIFDKQYLYRTPDGILRDFYVDSIPATIEVLRSLEKQNNRVWIITSAEVTPSIIFYLDQSQIKWLAEIERNYKPAFIARDNITKVYCLNCGENW